MSWTTPRARNTVAEKGATGSRSTTGAACLWLWLAVGMNWWRPMEEDAQGLLSWRVTDPATEPEPPSEPAGEALAEDRMATMTGWQHCRAQPPAADLTGTILIEVQSGEPSSCRKSYPSSTRPP